MLSRASGGVHYFDGQARVSLSLGGFIGPVGLGDLLPHYHIEPGAGLVAKHKASVIIIPLCVDEERPAKVHRVELVVP